MRYIKEKAPSVKSKVKQINKKIGKLVSKKEDAINKAKELADSEEPSGKMQASLAKIQLRQSESEAEKLMLQKQAEILKGKIDTAKKKEKTTKDIDIEEMENRPITILEGVMSDIHQMISNHKNFDSFQKEFFKEYGHKKVMKKTPEFLEWLEALYTDSQFAVAEADAKESLESESPNNITCGNCAWTWLRQDGGDDMYTCHKCGTDNAPSLGESTQNEGYQNFDGEMARDLKGDSGVKFKKGDKVTLEIQPNNYVIYGPNKTKIIVNKRDFRGAIDQYVIYESSTLNEEDSYNDYPAAAKKNAKKALDWRDEHGRDEVDAGTAVGWTRANQLAKGEKISADTVKRMASFNRHRKNSSIKPELKATPWKDKGYVSWLIWGGDEGVDWAMKKSKEIDNMKESKQMRYIKPLKESTEVNESSDQKKFKQFWDKGPETAIRKTFGKDYDKAIDNRIALLLTIVKDPDDAEKYSEMDFLSLPSGISSQLVNMDPKAIDSILDESLVAEGMSKSAIKKAIKVIDQQIEDEEGGDGEPLDNETLQALEQERERLLGMNESKFSPKGYAKRVVDGTIRIKDAMKEAGISLGNMAKLIAKIDKSFDVNAAFLEKNVMQNDPEKYVESRKNLKFVKHLHESFINDKDISDWEKEHGNLPIPKKIIDISKNMAKEGFIRKATKSVQAKLWIALEGKSWMEMKDQFGDIVGTFYGSTFYTQMTDTMSERAAYYAYSVSMGISDKVANDEEIEPAYYEMKSYFNAFGMDYGRNRIFDRAVSELESWMKKQKITTL